MVYQTIRLSAYKLKPNISKQNFYVMNFPDEAKEVIRKLTVKRDNRNAEEINLPVKSLYKGLRLAPGLIRIGEVYPKPEEFWLYSPQQLDTKKLYAILDYWIETEFPDEPGKRGKVGISFDERKLVMNCLRSENLLWKPEEVFSPNNFATHPNGTANLYGNDFIWLPHILATELTKPGLYFDLDGQKLQFYRTIPSNGKRADLFSWQPLNYTLNG